jgi:pentose-5-phosphate-3-epimerase
MTVAKKVEFAMKCNKEARTILIRDINRLVQMSVIRSPKITETEVVMIASNRSVHEDVLRYISTQRDWMKNYEVRVGLVFNPKTPLFISMKQVPTLKERELSKLGKSKSIPKVLSVTAVRRLHDVKK